MEISKIIFMHFLIVVVFAAHGCKSQHWSHGWLPGGKRNAMINDEGVVGEIETPRFQYLYENRNSPRAVVPDINEKNLQEKQNLKSNFQENIE
ncbi:progonadoliberin-1-like isoform X2 [Rhinoraja longicauda]